MAKKIVVFGVLIGLWALIAYGATNTQTGGERAIAGHLNEFQRGFIVPQGEISERLACILKCESNGNTEALGDYFNGEPRAFGCLQFWRGTFNQYCVREYGLAREEDFMNCEIQKECAYKMIEQGLEDHWTCNKKCKL